MPHTLSQKPNIVFFMLDQLSAKWLEKSFLSITPTPNLFWLRKNGVNFVQAITSNPLCCPARATLATGLSTRGHGVFQNGYELDPKIPTFMQILQANGWRTGAFGKVHFHAHYHGVHPDYHPYGFDKIANTEDPRAGYWLDWIIENHPEHLDGALSCIWAKAIPEMRAYGKEKTDLAARLTGRVPPYYSLPFPEQISQTAWITQNAIDFIHGVDPDQPLYAHISYVQPHSPFCPPGEFLELVNEYFIPKPIDPEWLSDPHHPAWLETSESARCSIPDNWREYRKYYFADLAHLDQQLGKVIQSLKDTGRWENTYFVYLSDHGELLMDHGFSGKGERHYDACVRVPLVIAGPGVQSGKEVGCFVQLEDIFPTVLEMAGIPLISQPVGGRQAEKILDSYPGRSLLAFCKGETPSQWRDSAFIESYNNIDSTTPDRWARTIRTSQWRYTLYPSSSWEQLFHLSEDPDETMNLAYNQAFQKIRQEMRDRLLDAIILQDYPSTPRSLYQIGVH